MAKGNLNTVGNVGLGAALLVGAFAGGEVYGERTAAHQSHITNQKVRVFFEKALIDQETVCSKNIADVTKKSDHATRAAFDLAKQGCLDADRALEFGKIAAETARPLFRCSTEQTVATQAQLNNRVCTTAIAYLDGEMGSFSTDGIDVPSERQKLTAIADTLTSFRPVSCNTPQE